MCAPVSRIVLLIAVFIFRMPLIFLQYRCTYGEVSICALCGLLGTFTMVSIHGVYFLGTIPGFLYEYMSSFLLLPLLHSDCTSVIDSP